jgi:hypothetical protein
MTPAEEVIVRYVLPIVIAYGLAWIVQRLSGRMVGRFMGLSEYAPERMRLRQERQRTLHDLLASTIGFIAFTVASVFTVGLLSIPRRWCGCWVCLPPGSGWGRAP